MNNSVKMYEIILEIFIPTVTVWAVTSNLLLMIVLIKFPKLLQPYNLMTRKVIITLDITFVASFCLLNLLVLHYGSETPILLCNYLSYTRATIMSCQCLTLAVMSIERYVYVVHPLKYNQLITKGRIVAGLLSCILMPTCFTVVSEYLTERKLSLKSLFCTSDHTIVVLAKMLIFIIPSFCCTIGISLSLWKMTRQIHNTNNAFFQPQVRKSFRLIAFISGCLWMTIFPAAVMVAIAIVFFQPFQKTRMSHYICTLCQQLWHLMNPILQFYVDKDLWIAVKKLCGKKVYFSYQKEYLEGIVSGKTDTITV